jgi:hypothetical protein
MFSLIELGYPVFPALLLLLFEVSKELQAISFSPQEKLVAYLQEHVLKLHYLELFVQLNIIPMYFSLELTSFGACSKVCHTLRVYNRLGIV